MKKHLKKRINGCTYDSRKGKPMMALHTDGVIEGEVLKHRSGRLFWCDYRHGAIKVVPPEVAEAMEITMTVFRMQSGGKEIE